MSRLRRTITLAFCGLLSLPLGAAALGFHADSEKYEFERHHESDAGTASWRDTLFLDTGTASAGHHRINLIALFARRGDGPSRIHELIFGHRENGMDYSKQYLEQRVSGHFDFFREIQNLDADADGHGSRFRWFGHHRHDRHGRQHAWARMRHHYHGGTSNGPPVPEPTTALLIGIGLVGLAVTGRRHDA